MWTYKNNSYVKLDFEKGLKKSKAKWKSKNNWN